MNKHTNNTKRFNFTWADDAWVIKELNQVNDWHIKADSLRINATHYSQDRLEGYVTAIYGLAQEDADRLDRRTLRALGVGNGAGHCPGPQNGCGRLHLRPGGRIERQ